jgi:23S rRNA (adenine2503-C2)-methyltransferase
MTEVHAVPPCQNGERQPVEIPVLSGMPVEELAERISPLPRFRAAQIGTWIASGVSSFDKMDNLPLPLRRELAERFTLRPDVTVQKHSGSDGTIKLALQFADGARIEAVLLTDSSGRRTACLSTQVGCPAGCVFCKTGVSFRRNLTSAEIVEQFLQLKTTADDFASQSPPAALPIANIVVMGMGEPLLNLAELRRSLAVITCPHGLHFSRRRITISTCGIVRGIIDLADNGPAARLALSLTTADESLRRRLMPITAREPLAAVKKALRHFQDSGGGRITLEAVLLGGINTRDKDAADMAQFAKGLDAVVNLIPWNPVKGLEFEGKALREPSAAEIESFTRRLKALGLNVTRRYRRGRGVMGACGQLGNFTCP